MIHAVRVNHLTVKARKNPRPRNRSPASWSLDFEKDREVQAVIHTPAAEDQGQEQDLPRVTHTPMRNVQPPQSEDDQVDVSPPYSPITDATMMSRELVTRVTTLRIVALRGGCRCRMRRMRVDMLESSAIRVDDLAGGTDGPREFW